MYLKLYRDDDKTIHHQGYLTANIVAVIDTDLHPYSKWEVRILTKMVTENKPYFTPSGTSNLEVVSRVDSNDVANVLSNIRDITNFDIVDIDVLLPIINDSYPASLIFPGDRFGKREDLFYVPCYFAGIRDIVSGSELVDVLIPSFLDVTLSEDSRFIDSIDGDSMNRYFKMKSSSVRRT